MQERVSGWIERNMARYRDDGFGLWAVCLKNTGEMIGDCGLTLQNILHCILIANIQISAHTRLPSP